MTQQNDSKTGASLAIFAVLLLVGAAVWWFGFRDSRDQVAKAQDEFNALLKGGELQEAPEALARKLNLPKGSKVRMVSAEGGDALKNLGSLSEDQMKEFAKGMLPGALAAGSDQAKRILDMPPKEQKKALDEMIDKQQAAKKAMKDMLKPGEAGTKTEITKDDSGNNVEIRQTITLNGEGLEGQKMMMDMTDPEQRAVMDEFKKLMDQRMEERGIDPDEGGSMIMIGIDAMDVTASGE